MNKIANNYINKFCSINKRNIFVVFLLDGNTFKYRVHSITKDKSKIASLESSPYLIVYDLPIYYKNLVHINDKKIIPLKSFILQTLDRYNFGAENIWKPNFLKGVHCELKS